MVRYLIFLSFFIFSCSNSESVVQKSYNFDQVFFDVVEKKFIYEGKSMSVSSNNPKFFASSIVSLCFFLYSACHFSKSVSFFFLFMITPYPNSLANDCYYD